MVNIYYDDVTRSGPYTNVLTNSKSLTFILDITRQRRRFIYNFGVYISCKTLTFTTSSCLDGAPPLSAIFVDHENRMCDVMLSLNLENDGGGGGHYHFFYLYLI